MKRYFIVFYETAKPSRGMITISTENGLYLNCAAAMKHIAEQTNVEHLQVLITNIIEFNKQDYSTFTEEL